MTCQNCGSESRDDAIFCTNCGKRFETGSAGSGPVTTGPVTTGPEPPCVSAIPAPPQMPDLPAPPQMPTPQAISMPEPGSFTTQSLPHQTPAEPVSYINTPPVSQPPPFTQQPGIPPQPGPYTQSQQRPPAQQYYQPPPQSYMPPAYPPVSGQKKSKAGLIIGITAGAAVLIAIMIAAVSIISNFISNDRNFPDEWLHGSEAPFTERSPGILATPAPAPPPPMAVEPLPLPERLPPSSPYNSNNALIGNWELESGDWIWFFGKSNLISFTELTDDTFGVHVSESGNFAECFFDAQGFLIVESDDGWDGYFEFTWIIQDERLTIIDSDGDMIHYNRIN